MTDRKLSEKLFIGLDAVLDKWKQKVRDGSSMTDHNISKMFSEMAQVQKDVEFLRRTTELLGPLPCRFNTDVDGNRHHINLFFDKQTSVSIRFQLDEKSKKCTEIYVQTDSSIPVDVPKIQEMAKMAVLKCLSVSSDLIDKAVAAIKFPDHFYWSFVDV
jgi:hypothetical protein